MIRHFNDIEVDFPVTFYQDYRVFGVTEKELLKFERKTMPETVYKIIGRYGNIKNVCIELMVNDLLIIYIQKYVVFLNIARKMHFCKTSTKKSVVFHNFHTQIKYSFDLGEEKKDSPG